MQAANKSDFATGKIFTLTVKGKAGIGAVPSGIPNFKFGQKVKFTIGANGELKGSGFSILYTDGVPAQNNYANKSTPTALLPHQAVVKKRCLP